MALLSFEEQRAWIDAGMALAFDIRPKRRLRRRRSTIICEWMGRPGKRLNIKPEALYDLIRDKALSCRTKPTAKRGYRYATIINSKLVFKTRRSPPLGWSRDLRIVRTRSEDTIDQARIDQARIDDNNDGWDQKMWDLGLLT
jgi:hypothetical protein